MKEAGRRERVGAESALVPAIILLAGSLLTPNHHGCRHTRIEGQTGNSGMWRGWCTAMRPGEGKEDEAGMDVGNRRDRDKRRRR